MLFAGHWLKPSRTEIKERSWAGGLYLDFSQVPKFSDRHERRLDKESEWDSERVRQGSPGREPWEQSLMRMKKNV